MVHGDVHRDGRGEHDEDVGRDIGCDEGGHGGAGGDAVAGGDGVQRTGESTISSSHPSSLSSSTSHRRLAAFLVRFAGGGDAGGDVASVGNGVGANGGDSGFGGGTG